MEFYKLEATGNDTIITILDDVNNLNIKQLCDRHKGIGADGLINIDSYYNVSFYNADGSSANMCGNGLRCVSKLLYYLTKKKDNTIYINSKETYLKQVKDNISCINMPSLFMVKQDDYYLVELINKKVNIKGDEASAELIVTINTGRKVLNYTFIFIALAAVLVALIILRKKLKK